MNLIVGNKAFFARAVFLLYIEAIYLQPGKLVLRNRHHREILGVKTRPVNRRSERSILPFWKKITLHRAVPHTGHHFPLLKIRFRLSCFSSNVGTQQQSDVLLLAVFPQASGNFDKIPIRVKLQSLLNLQLGIPIRERQTYGRHEMVLSGTVGNSSFEHSLVDTPCYCRLPGNLQSKGSGDIWRELLWNQLQGVTGFTLVFFELKAF